MLIIISLQNIQVYEGIVKHNPHNVDAISFLAVWHLERHSFQIARKFFAHLASLRKDEADIWLCLCIACSLGDDFKGSVNALTEARKFIRTPVEEVRMRYCYGKLSLPYNNLKVLQKNFSYFTLLFLALLLEKQNDYQGAMEGYTTCLNQCSSLSMVINEQSHDSVITEMEKSQRINFLKDIRGEIMLRIAMLKKDMGAVDQAMHLCNTIANEFSEAIKANALCLKGVLHEMKSEYPTAEVVYRSVLNFRSDHCIALERLGRVYLRYRETIPAAVQCFFKAVEINPSNSIAWYLLGRCYMATSQYSDACEAYNRSVNINPNDAQTWCSLGVLYYAFGQYREALGMLSRALKLDPTMADAWYNVGALYDMCDQPEDAQMAYHKAKEFGVSDRFAKVGIGINPLATQRRSDVSTAASQHRPQQQQQHYVYHGTETHTSQNAAQHQQVMQQIQQQSQQH